MARREPVENLFKAIGSEIGKAVRFSNKARQYRVSGEFDLDAPFDIIERVTGSLGLIWYFDGQVIYVYDNSEASSAMLSIAPDAVDGLIGFLKKSALYDSRFPIRHNVGTRLLYVSGPPKYIEIVQGAASLLHTQVEVTQRGERFVELVKIRHASVGTRSYSRRDNQTTVAGLANVLAAALGTGASVVDAHDQEAGGGPATAPGPASRSGSSAQPGNDAALPLPAGVNELPSLMPGALSAETIAPSRVAPAQSSAPAAARRASLGETQPMTIVAYTASNSLLLEGTAQQLATARRLIDQLDRPNEQVELSLWVIDVEKGQFDTLGAKWAASARLGNVEVGFNPGLIATGATLSRTETVQFIAEVSALSRQRQARIVSRPILLAQDNNPAVFDNSKTFLIQVRGERVAALERITYGTMIDVTPRVVDRDGRIEMELNIEDGNSSNPDRDSGLQFPVVASTRISTLARVQHEQSILVGGYTQSHNTVGTTKIPLLGDLPWVGRLFTFRSTSDDQSVRLFLIQPRLLQKDHRFETDRITTPVEIRDAVDALRQQVERPNA